MPYDKSNQYKNESGRMTEKWNFLLKCFGNRTSLDKFGLGWKNTAKLIRKTNSKHSWNLLVSGNKIRMNEKTICFLGT